MSSNVVIDISHHQANVDFAAVAADGIVGVFHKATQGLGYVDPRYAERQPLALAAGLLWGAYHFGVDGDGVAQADAFLAAANWSNSTLLALDFEANPQGGNMTLDQARAFINRVIDVTGRPPGLYGGGYLKGVLGNNSDTTLLRCWLWIAQYATAPTIPPNWAGWNFWQYTDGTNGPQPHTVAGVGACDRDIYTGSVEDLRQLWVFTPPSTTPVDPNAPGDFPIQDPPVAGVPAGGSETPPNANG